jgi:hypothetical protein
VSPTDVLQGEELEQLRVVPLPTFSAPPSPPPAPPEGGPATNRPAPNPISPGPRGDGPAEPGSPTADTSTARTTSSAGRRRPGGIDAEALAGVVAGVLMLTAGGLAWLASKRRLYLRPPNEQECADVAGPLARIVARHTDAAWLTLDLTDGLEAAVAAVAYGQTRPLQRGVPARPSMPNPPEETP